MGQLRTPIGMADGHALSAGRHGAALPQNAIRLAHGVHGPTHFEERNYGYLYRH
jgi:hypothetical protein